MKRMPWRLTALAMAAVGAAGCSGSGGGSDDNGATLTLSLMDAPVDDVDQVTVEIAALWLKPEEGPPVELPLVEEPLTVDLLELTDENAALMVNGATIEPGTYEWIEMDVNADHDNVQDSFVMTTTGNMHELRVPSGRVRLVGGFEVGANEAVRLLFDWDLRKGLVAPPGLPGYLLRPAFRVIDVVEHRVVSGTIAMSSVTLIDNDCNADTELEDYDVGNTVYVYAGHGAVPDDIDGSDPEPVATVDAARNSAGDYEYRVLLGPGDYTLAFTCVAGNDSAEGDEAGSTVAADDTVVFIGTHDVDVPEDMDAGATFDF